MPTMNTDQRCSGKIVLVTGAQRGIGRAIAVRFAEAGADVALNYLDDKAAAEAAAAEITALGRRVTTLPRRWPCGVRASCAV